jgi:hypothetical protein
MQIRLFECTSPTSRSLRPGPPHNPLRGRTANNVRRIASSRLASSSLDNQPVVRTPPPSFDIQAKVDFLKEDLTHLFDDRGIDASAYEEVVDFRDPVGIGCPRQSCTYPCGHAAAWLAMHAAMPYGRRWEMDVETKSHIPMWPHGAPMLYGCMVTCVRPMVTCTAHAALPSQSSHISG